MGVYTKTELTTNLNYDDWKTMLEIHKKDLEMYNKSFDYPSKHKDIIETTENISILLELICEHNTIYDSDRCLGDWYGIRCSLSPRWFVETVDGYYRCQECKSVYKKNNDGTYTLIKE